MEYELSPATRAFPCNLAESITGASSPGGPSLSAAMRSTLAWSAELVRHREALVASLLHSQPASQLRWGCKQGEG